MCSLSVPTGAEAKILIGSGCWGWKLYIYGSWTAGIIYVFEKIIMNNANSTIKIEWKDDISPSGDFREKSQFQSFSDGPSGQVLTVLFTMYSCDL